MKSKTRILDNAATLPRIIPLFIVGLAVYLLMLLVTIPRLRAFATGMEIPDMMPFGYGSQYILQLMESLGAEGRHYYLWRQIPLDMIYPILFGLSCSLILAYLYKKAFRQDHWFKIANFIPLVAAMFDYLENIGVALILGRYPDFSPAMANITCVFSITKSMATMLFYLILIIYLFLILKERFQRSSN